MKSSEVKLKALNKELAAAEKQKAAAYKKQESIRKKIENLKKRNEFKSIMDRVNNFKDILKIAKPTKEELDLINYKGSSKRILFLSRMLKLVFISEVLNEGHIPTMKEDERRYYPWFYISSGFAFRGTNCGGTYAHAASAARLCLHTPEKAKFAAETFLKEYEEAIMLW